MDLEEKRSFIAPQDYGAPSSYLASISCAIIVLYVTSVTCGYRWASREKSHSSTSSHSWESISIWQRAKHPETEESTTRYGVTSSNQKSFWCSWYRAKAGWNWNQISSKRGRHGPLDWTLWLWKLPDSQEALKAYFEKDGNKSKWMKKNPYLVMEAYDEIEHDSDTIAID